MKELVGLTVDAPVSSRWLWVVLTLVGLCVGLSGGVNAGIGVTNGLAHSFVAEPGGIYQGEITVLNGGESPQRLELSQTDYLFFADGRNIYGEPGSVPRSNSSWITLFPPLRSLNPGETVSVRFEIKVPNDPSLVGSYWSMVMVSAQPPPGETPEEGKVVVRQVTRYGIQIVTHIGETGKRKIQILDAVLLREDEEAVLQIDVEDVGERYVSPKAWVEVYDPEGLLIGRFESRKLGVYPGCSVRHRFPLAGVPSGKYKALVIFDNGDEYVWGAQYDLEL